MLQRIRRFWPNPLWGHLGDISYRGTKRDRTFAAHALSQWRVKPDGDTDPLPDGHGAIRVRMVRRWGWDIYAYRAGPTRFTDRGAISWSIRSTDLKHVDFPSWQWMNNFLTVRATTPILLINNAPAATGFGSGRIVLPEGNYLVHVQAGHSGEPRVVTVKAGETVELDSVTSTHRSPAALEGALRRNYADQSLAPRNYATIREHVSNRLASPVLTTMFISLPLFLWLALGLSRFWFPSDDDTIDTAVIGTMLAMGAIAVFSSLVLSGEHWWRIVGSRFPAATLPFGTNQGERPLVLDVHQANQVRSGPDQSYLFLHAAYRQNKLELETFYEFDEVTSGAKADRHRRTQETGEPQTQQIRPWVPPPLVWINGHPMPATWGPVAYPLAPGTYRLTVAVPPPPEIICDDDTELDLENAVVERDIEISAVRDSAVVNVDARLTVTPRPGSVALASYAATLTECEWESKFSKDPKKAKSTL